MKKLLLLFIPLMFFFSCEEDGPTYACTDTGCVEDAAGSYDTLESCESTCCQTCSMAVEIHDTPYWEEFNWEKMGYADADEFAQEMLDQYESETWCGDELQSYIDAWEDMTSDYDDDGLNEYTVTMNCQ
tara:strand:- start:52 stop:438 length:387 start_codon:yes stop_codon:yes gene_type:complete